MLMTLFHWHLFSLNRLYSICKQYGHSHNMAFNPQKSKLLVFGSDIQGCVIDKFLTCQPTCNHQIIPLSQLIKMI